MTIIGFVYMLRTNCKLKCSCCSICKDSMKRDINDIYGTYSRGENGEGDYGDGDRVYAIDSNDYYQDR